MLHVGLSPWPSFTEEESQAVARTILSNKVNYWTGVECREFEREFAAWAGTTHAVALANGTVALELAVKALGIGPGDEVIVTPRTFIASVACIVNAGAKPVFAEVDADSQNITANSIQAVLSPSTKAVICVHLAGWPCEMDDIVALARARGLKVIEDCAQAHGARYRGRMVGSLGDVAAWSFCQDKIITTGGEGGMVTTDDPELSSRMWSFKDHGRSCETGSTDDAAEGFRWRNNSFGTNGRMLEVQAVIGRIQLRHVERWVEQRTDNALRLVDVCRRCPAVRVPTAPAHIKHAYYRFYAFVEPHHLATGWSRNRIVDELMRQGVFCYSGSCPEVYLEKAFDGTSFRPPERLPVARTLGETSLAFLVHPTLRNDEMERKCGVLGDVLSRASRS